MIEDKTKFFFDSVASNYSKRYQLKDKRSIFFNNRLKFSLNKEDFYKKSVLDIGAGSGIIYHKLKDVLIKYTGCDISEKIMKDGGIPRKFYRVIQNNLEDLLEGEKYDYIFILGVSTYLSKKEFENYIKQVERCSKEGTKVIISYTLNNYIHNTWRKIITELSNRIFKSFFKDKKLLVNSGIQMTYFNAKDCFKISDNLKVYDYNYQNIFLPPFDRIFPYFMLSFVDKLVNKLFGQNLFKFLGSDLSVKYIYDSEKK